MGLSCTSSTGDLQAWRRRPRQGGRAGICRVLASEGEMGYVFPVGRVPLLRSHTLI